MRGKAMEYTEQFETKKAVSLVVCRNTQFSIDYVIRKPIGASVNNITASISLVTAEDTGIQNRIGNAYVDVDNNRNYFAIDKSAEIVIDDQAAVVAQYFKDIKSILTT